MFSRRFLLSVFLLLVATLAHAEPRQVRIVKQGVDHNRTFDGNAYGIAQYHRYRIDRNPDTGLWQRRLAWQDFSVSMGQG